MTDHLDEPLSPLAKANDELVASQPGRDLIVISHSINRALHYKLTRALKVSKRNDSCTVFLTTNGGDPNAAFRIARCLRHHYNHVRLAVPGFCKSAGTLIAIAADELAIGDLGELGPLDVQVRKGTELSEQSSGLDITQALQAVSFHSQNVFHRVLVDTRNFGLSTRMCAEFAAKVASGFAAPLLRQIDPMKIGEMQRATAVAVEYGERLNRYARNLKEGALNLLVGSYPAHGFVIDRKEAKELFHRVSGLTDQENQFCDLIAHISYRESSSTDPWFIEEINPQRSENVAPVDAGDLPPDSVGPENAASSGE
ncbi:hypothetical protein [Silanimonas sp.]|jgi:hypothetical protein|uniref:SDH family Clp fold serine proteinase n=1 Tax=Silanimonas sp. TaxID=1929290 RepID=UPI0037CBD774